MQVHKYHVDGDDQNRSPLGYQIEQPLVQAGIVASDAVGRSVIPPRFLASRGVWGYPTVP